MKKLFYIALGLLCWSCNNNDYEDIIGSSTPEKETKVITYEYPSYGQILNSDTKFYMSMAWGLTKDMAAKGERREIGFYIFSTKVSGLFTITTGDSKQVLS